MKQTIASQLLKLKYRQLLHDQKNPAQAQQQSFRRLQHNMRGTEIAQQVKLSSFRNYRDYVHAMPALTYEHLEERVIRGLKNKNDLFQGPCEFIGLSSGTTGKGRKQVPYNRAMRDLFNEFQWSFASLLEHSGGMRVLTDHRLTWGTSPLVDFNEDHIQRGYVSGYLSLNSPALTRKLNYPSESVSMIRDMTQKAAAAAGELADADIHMVAGVPTYVTNLLEELTRLYGMPDLKQIWPNCHLMVYSATAIEPYAQQLRRLLGEQLQFLGCYIATEGAFGYEIPELSAHQGRYSFHLSGLVFGFRRLTDGRVLAIDELSRGDEVEVLISGPNGFLNYSLGDVIRICETDPLNFEILGRIGQGLNLTTEKVSVRQLNQAIDRVSRDFRLNLDHYFVCPGEARSGKPSYHWTLVTDGSQIKSEQLAMALDSALGDVCEDYEENRKDLALLAAPTVSLMPAAPFKAFFTDRCSQGQLKVKSVFESQDEFRAYVQDMAPPEMNRVIG